MLEGCFSFNTEMLLWTYVNVTFVPLHPGMPGGPGGPSCPGIPYIKRNKLAILAIIQVSWHDQNFDILYKKNIYFIRTGRPGFPGKPDAPGGPCNQQKQTEMANPQNSNDEMQPELCLQWWELKNKQQFLLNFLDKITLIFKISQTWHFSNL